MQADLVSPYANNPRNTPPGRMIYSHDFHSLAIAQEIISRSNVIAVHYDIVAILPSFVWHIVS